MKTKITIALLAALALLALPVRAQITNTNVTLSMTNAFLGPNLAVTALNLLPAWDKTATNSFASGELELKLSPAWKSATAAGATPYLDNAFDYFFSRHFGAEGEFLMFGSGDGTSTIDAANVNLVARADSGNIAGYLLLGGGRDFNQNKWELGVGPGIEYRYTSGVGIFFDTRFMVNDFSNTSKQNWLTRAGASIHF